MKRLVAAMSSALVLLGLGSAVGAATIPPVPGRSAPGPGLLPATIQRLIDPAPAPTGQAPSAPGPATPAPPDPLAPTPPGAPGVTPLAVEPASPPSPPAPSPVAAKPGGLRPLAETSVSPFAGLPLEGYAGYASGAVVHADALQSASTRLADVEVAFSGAGYTSSTLAKAIQNEVSRVVTPKLDAFSGYGRGSGLEVGLGVTPSGENQIVLPGKVEAKAPPSTPLVTKEEGPINADPLAAARLLRGQAQGRAVSNGCVIGSDLGYGLGYVVDLGLVNTPASPLVSTTAASPDRAVSQSVSRTTLVKGTSPGHFGLMSESRQTIAPVTFFKGSPNQFTIEVLGEWVLRATADGTTGSVHYGPAEKSPETPVVRIIDAAGKVTNVLTLQQLLGEKGLTVEVPGGVAEIAVGEAPRALGGAGGSKATTTGTVTSAAVDVVRVRLLEQGETHAADVRVGHMETAVAVPAGGIACGIGMAKKADPEAVRPGQDFTWTVTVSNPHDCTLTDVKVVDTIATEPSVASSPITYSVLGETPAASTTTPSELTWNDIGPIGPGQSKELRISMRVGLDSGAGRFVDTAVATAMCGPAAAQGSANAAAGAAAAPVALEGRIVLRLPEISVVLGRALPATLPRTGGLGTGLLPALGLVGTGFALHRLTRRRSS